MMKDSSSSTHVCVCLEKRFDIPRGCYSGLRITEPDDQRHQQQQQQHTLSARSYKVKKIQLKIK